MFKLIKDWLESQVEEDRPKTHRREESVAQRNTRAFNEHLIRCNECKSNTAKPVPDTTYRYRCGNCNRFFNGPKHNLVNHKGEVVYDGTNGRFRRYT